MYLKKKRRQNRETNVRYILPRNKGEISTSIIQNWTDQAIRCYRSGSNCSDCSIMKGNYSFVCQMPKIINLLLEQIGEPEEERIKKHIA